MPETISPAFQTPPIVFIFCCLAAMAVYVAMVRWIWVMRTDDKKRAGTLQSAITWSQIYIFLGVTVLSLLVTVYAFFFGAETIPGVTIIPELLILSGVSLFFARHYRRSGQPVLKGLLAQGVAVFFWAAASVGAWAVVLAIGGAAYFFISILSRNASSDIMVFVVVATTLGMNGLLYAIHFRARKFPEAQTLRGLPLQTYLWPVVLVLVLLMFPLWLQETVNSPKWQTLKYEKPIRLM